MSIRALLLWLQVIHQNGGFTHVWMCLKTLFFPMVAAVLAWFIRRIKYVQKREPNLLER